jgi:type II secretory pathway component PulF
MNILDNLVDTYYSYFAVDAPLMRAIARHGYGASARSRLYLKLSSLVKNGKRLQSSIEDLRDRARKRSETDIEAIALTEIAEHMMNGQSFSSALSAYAPPGELMLIQAGEESGELVTALQLAVRLITASTQMKIAVRGALVSPIFMMLMVLVSLLIVGNVVVPKLAVVFDPDLWTGVARSLYLVSLATQSPWILAPIIGIILFCLLIAFTLPYWTGRIRVFFDILPPWSMYRLILGSGWLLSLASLIKSGVTLSESLIQMNKLSKPWMRERIDATLFYINNGFNLGVALERSQFNFPDREIVDDLVSYAELPEFDEVLYRIGNDWVTDGLEAVQTQASILNIVATLVLALVIIWFSYGTIAVQLQISQYFSSMGSGGF